MHRPLSTLFLLLISTLTCLGAAIQPSKYLTDTGYIITSIWAEGGTLDNTPDCSFHLTLKSKDLDGLASKMEQISLSNQGKWLTEAELDPFVRPAPETTKTVMEFLHSAGVPDSAITTSTKFGDRLNVTLPMAQVTKLFTNPFWDTHVDSKQFTKVKQSLEEKRQGTKPATTIATPLEVHQVSADKTSNTATKVTRRDGAPASCDASKVTPACLKDLYGVSSYQPFKTNVDNPDVTTVSDVGHFVNLQDIDAYVKKYVPGQEGYKMTIETAFGGYNDESKADLEGTYTTQALVGMMAPLKVNFLITRKIYWYDFHELVINLFIDNYDEKNRPKIVSIPFSSFEDYNTDAQMITMCNAAMKLTALGTTIVTTSGMNGIGEAGEKCPPSRPSYPASCPFITSVGFTEGFAPEKMFESQTLYQSGAGASNVFPIPSWQAKDLAAYQKTLGPLAFFNASGRAYPTIVANGRNSTHIFQGKELLVSGEGSGVQTAVSVLAWVNNKRAAAGLGNLGWFEPSLYAFGPLHDITLGGSFGCKLSKPDVGLPAALNYDISSGLGSVHFDALCKALGV